MRMKEPIVPRRSEGDIRTASLGGSKSQSPWEILTARLKQIDKRVKDKASSESLVLEELSVSWQHTEA